ncbi:MAG: thiamine diphosphokinase [Clostridiales bacterium]|jgi:thiamine pyrophosphokinase|nr:thiamine diphosphokinase [Clostridiales bacterium]
MENTGERRCVIITAYINGGLKAAYTPQRGDYILCADGGYTHARQLGLAPQLVIGDCDSCPDVPPALLRKTPAEKDDTDTMLCMRHCIRSGFTRCVIIGGIGGRLDHTIANIQSLAFAKAHGVAAVMCDAFETVFLLCNQDALLPRREGVSLSAFAYTEGCHGVYESGVKYPLHNATLTQRFPLGVSNEITGDTARVSVREGMLLVIQSKLRE